MDDDESISGPDIEILQLMTLEAGNFIPGDQLSFNVIASPGSGDLISFWIERNGDLLPTDEFMWNGGFIPEHPYTLDAFQANGFDFRIRTELPEVNNTQTVYRVYVKDEDDRTQYAEMLITSGTATPVSLTTGKLYNPESGPGRGALDLDEGFSLSAADTTAELRNLGGSGDDWKTIAPFTYSDLRPSQLVFGPIRYVEEISKSYRASFSLDFAMPGEGDVFTVRRDSSYYLILIDKISEDPDSGEDYIRFQIKR